MKTSLLIFVFIFISTLSWTAADLPWTAANLSCSFRSRLFYNIDFYQCKLKNVDLDISLVPTTVNKLDDAEETTKVREPLTLIIKKGRGPVPNITENTFKNIDSVIDVRIKGFAPRWVSPFKNFESVRAVHLYGNIIRRQIRDTNISSEYYREFPGSLIQGIPYLKTIRLLFQNITHLSTSSLTEVPEILEEFVGIHISLKTIESGTFSRLTNLKTIKLSQNILSVLHRGMFDGLVRLETLDLSINRLSTLELGLFANLTSLRYLSLDSNQLTQMPDGIFSNLPSIKTLNPEQNGMSYGLVRLESLDLGRNRLSTLVPGIFANLTSLRHLDLGSNQLTQLPNGIFSNLSNLEELNLVENDLITPIGPFIEGLHMLKSWSCGNLKFYQIEDAAQLHCYDRNTTTSHNKDCYFIDTEIEIKLHRNSSTLSLDKNSSEYEELFYLTMQPSWAPYHIGIVNVTEEVFSNLPKLKYIQVSYMQIRGAIPFKNQESVQAVSFVENFFTEFPREFCTAFPKLKTLELEHQNINELTKDSFFGISESLEKLRLEHNQLKTIGPGTFSIFKNLKTLNLMNNKLKILPSNLFDDLRSLEMLHLQYNSISELDPNIINLPSLRQISVSSESLDTGSRKAFTEAANSKGFEMILTNGTKSYHGVSYPPSLMVCRELTIRDPWP